MNLLSFSIFPSFSLSLSLPLFLHRKNVFQRLSQLNKLQVKATLWFHIKQLYFWKLHIRSAGRFFNPPFFMILSHLSIFMFFVLIFQKKFY